MFCLHSGFAMTAFGDVVLVVTFGDVVLVVTACATARRLTAIAAVRSIVVLVGVKVCDKLLVDVDRLGGGAGPGA